MNNNLNFSYLEPFSKTLEPSSNTYLQAISNAYTLKNKQKSIRRNIENKQKNIIRNIEIEERIKKRRRPGCNPYGGMGMDGNSEEELKQKREELEYLKYWDV